MFKRTPWRQDKRFAEIRSAVTDMFGAQRERALEILAHVTEQEWKQSYLWLDASGMALYLIDFLVKHRRTDVLPAGVHHRLQQNLEDNRFRTADLLREMENISADFMDAGITFANVKGLSLPPESVPDAGLRCQLDLDFLIAPHDILQAISVLERHGYRLHAISDKTWEFKTAVAGVPSIRDLYKPKPHRSLELHFAYGDRGRTKEFPCIAWRRIGNLQMPVLPAAEIFIGQACHLFEHLRGEFTRISWLLEFKRHMDAHREDSFFWSAVKRAAVDSEESRLALGVVGMLVNEIFAVDAPDALKSWTIDCLPQAHVLWVQEYGRRAMLANFPGGKLFVLLAEAQASLGTAAEYVGRKRILPFRLPPSVLIAPPNESYAKRLKRYSTQLQFLFFRARFHLVEGARCAMELPRWQRRLKEMSN